MPVSVGAYVPLLLLAHPSVPANNLKEFVAYAKTAKEPLFYGSTGPGSIMNLMAEVLKRDTGIKMDHVPFRGAAPLVTELFRPHPVRRRPAFELARTGAHAARSRRWRSPPPSTALPDVPTVRELGFPNLELRGWNGFFAPKGTPEAIVARLQSGDRGGREASRRAQAHDRRRRRAVGLDPGRDAGDAARADRQGEADRGGAQAACSGAHVAAQLQ